MVAPLGSLGAPRKPPGTRIEPWDERYSDGAARLIAAAYRSHIDSEINDQYRTPAGSRRFLSNIVLYPGCGAFQSGASFAAFQHTSGEIAGMSLASIVAPGTGHITQICVAPAARHSGIGTALLIRSLEGLRHAGCAEVSLTVTADNTSAIRLYERLGFRVLREFAAYVWERA